MKKETLARWIVIILVLAAVAVPLTWKWVAWESQPRSIELRARMPENGGWSVDAIQAQVGQPVRLHMTSDDVIHGFAVGRTDQPEVEIRPGEYVDATLTFDHPGQYTFYCTRWCGRNHWRMRGTIEVSGAGQPLPADPQPLFLTLGIDVDAFHTAAITPSASPAPERGAQFASLLPAYAQTRETYLTHSPEAMWQRLRSEPSLASLNDGDLWDIVAWLWQRQTTSQGQAEAQRLYATNCAACHGETGTGDGVMVQGLPRWTPSMPMGGETTHTVMSEGLVAPPDFTDPGQLLGASPALLEGKIIRGGMGTGMPYWGPIFTPEQIDALVSYIYGFAWKGSLDKSSGSP